MRLEFRAVDRSLESLHVDDLDVAADETVAISSVLELHCVVKESRGALNSVLQTIRKLSPKGCRAVPLRRRDSERVRGRSAWNGTSARTSGGGA